MATHAVEDAPVSRSAPDAHAPGDGAGAAPARTSARAWYMAGMLSLAYLLSLLDRYLLSVVLEDVKAYLHLTDTQLGILQGPSFVLIFLIASIPSGRLADIASRKWTIFAGLSCWSLATLGCGMAESFWQLMAARLAIGLGEAALIPSALSMIAASFSRATLNRGTSIFSMGSSLGKAAAFSLGGAVFAWLSGRGGLSLALPGHFQPWQGVFVIAALAGLAFTLLFALTIREPARLARTGPRTSFASGFAFFWRHRRAYLSVFIPFSMSVGIAALLAAWSVSFYVRQHGVSVAYAANVVGLTGLIAGPTGHLFGGWFSDRLRVRGWVGREPYVIVGAVLWGAFFTAFFLLTPSLKVAGIAYCLAYFALSAAGPIGFGASQLPTPDRCRGVLSSLLLICYSALGSMTPPLLVGLLNDALFDQQRLGGAILVTLAILVLVALPFPMLGGRAYMRAVKEA